MGRTDFNLDLLHGLDAVQPAAAAKPQELNLPGYQRFTAFPGIDLITLILPPGTPFSTDFIKKERIFEFGYILNGTAKTFLHDAPSSSVEISAKSSVSHYLPCIPAFFEVAPQPDVRMLGIEVHLDVLGRMLQGREDDCPRLARIVEAGTTSRFFESTGARGLSGVVAGQILSCPYTGLTRNLFLQAKVLEFLSIQMDTINSGGTSRIHGLLTRNEEQRIRDARKMLSARMTEPPTLAELSDLTGLNLTKLKKGFKLVFGKTAYACFLEDRMERAHALLSQGHMNVSQVAWEVGYINVSHFSTAFRKQYGVMPKAFQMAGL